MPAARVAMAIVVETLSSSGPASTTPPLASRWSRTIAPNASRPTRVFSVTGLPSRASPSATFAGLPPGWAASVRPPRCPTRSTSASPTTTNMSASPHDAQSGALAPAVPDAPGDVLGRYALGRVAGDERDAGVLVAGRLRASARCSGQRVDAQTCHVLRVLLDRRVDDARSDLVLDRVAAAVDRDEDHVVLAAAGRFQRLCRAGGRRLVHRIDDVDVRVQLEQRPETVLRAPRLAQRVDGAHDPRVAVPDPEAVQEAGVAQLAAGDAGREVEHGDLRLDAALNHLRLRIPPDELAGLVVVGGIERVDGGRRLGRRVERDHRHAGSTRLLDRRHD